MAPMKKITSYFDACRSSCSEKSIRTIDDILKESLLSKKIISREVLQDVIHYLCDGSPYPLSLEQEDDILEVLIHNSVGGKPNTEVWGKLLRYWMRKDTSDRLTLLIIDVQNDFISGSLALKNCPAEQDGGEVVHVINTLKKEFKFDLVVFTYDWHPKDHCSYITNVSKYPIHNSSRVTANDAKMFDTVVYDGEKPQSQILWPVHCEQDSEGAKLDSRLLLSQQDQFVYKGIHSNIDSYSAFWDNGKLSQTCLLSLLLENNITGCLICGLATDFCVSYSCIDCAEHGFDTYMINDACRGVSNDSIENAIKRMTNAGVKIINHDQVKFVFQEQH